MADLPVDTPEFAWAYRRPPFGSPTWAAGPTPTENKRSALYKFGAGAVGLSALGFVPVRGQRLWGSYISGVRALEEISPLRILRTFQYSELLSPLASEPIYGIGGEVFAGARSRELLGRMTGRAVGELERVGAFSQGLEFRRTGAVFGQLSVRGGPVLSSNALPWMSAGHGGSAFTDWFARASGMGLGAGSTVLGKTGSVRFALAAPKIERILGYPIPAQASIFLSRARTLGRLMRAYWAGQIGRLNKLLQTPVDIFPSAGRWMGKLGLSLAIQPGTATQMLWRYTRKGMAIALGYEAIKYLSYRRGRSESRLASTAVGAGVGAAAGGALLGVRGAIGGAVLGTIFGGAPLFDKGIFEGFAGAWAGSSMSYSRFSESTGLTQSAREQEAFMPGITKARTALGFTVAGGMLGMLTGSLLKGAMYTKSMGQLGGAAGYAAAKEYFAGGTKGIVRLLTTKGTRLGAMAGLGLYSVFAATAAAATGHVVPGIVAAEHTPEELGKLYSGQQYVPVRKGRWWEFGRTPWEGGRTMLYKPHWYPLMQSKAMEKGLFGSEEERWYQTRWLHPIKSLFDEEYKYRWETQHYRDRPYPMTGTWGEDVPFLGPVVAPTIGRLIKPPRLMHQEEWLSGTGATAYLPTTTTPEPAYELGGLPPGLPVSPYNAEQEIGEFIYRMNELRGLTGFVHGAIKGALTGREEYFDKDMRMATANMGTSYERRYWEREYGGLLMSTEAFRRFLPHRRRQIPLYNPLANTMPSWLPGPEYITDFRHGDPFAKVPYGDIRLPGAGYEALNPDVAGLSAEEYPLLHRYKILADVAVWSDQYKAASHEIDRSMRQGLLSEQQAAQVEEIRRQVRDKKLRRRFTDYKFTEDYLDKIKVTVGAVTRPGEFTAEDLGTFRLAGVDIAAQQISESNAATIATPRHKSKQAQISDFLREYIQPGAEIDVYVHRDPIHRYKLSAGKAYQPAVVVANGRNVGRELVQAGLASYEAEASPFRSATEYSEAQRAIGGLWERVAHTEPAYEYLTPLSPFAKFVHQRTAIEEYERTRVFGTEAAFWQHPIEQFMQPFGRMAARQMGSTEIPEDVQRRRTVEEYFDKLKWYKYHMLEQVAREQGDITSVKEFKDQKRRTLFGLNPFGNPMTHYAAIPNLERDYYEAFLNVQSPDERKRVLELVPENEKPLFLARWAVQLQKAIEARKRMGIADDTSLSLMNEIEWARRTEGKDISPALLREYGQRKNRELSYADWAREEELATYNQRAPLPGPDWVGYHPHVDLEDVKLRVVTNLGEDMHDYNLWESRQRELARRPYLVGSEIPISESILSAEERRRQLEQVTRRTTGTNNVLSRNTASPISNDVIDVEINDSRLDVLKKYKRDPDFQGMM